MSGKYFTGNIAKKYIRIFYVAFILIFLVFTATLFFVSSSAKAEKPSKPAATSEKNNPTSTPQVPTQVPASSVNPVTQAAVKAGILTSVNRINQVISYLTRGSQSGACLFVNKNAPDQHLFSTSLEVVPPNAASIYATASFAPNPSGMSDSVYETVEYLDESRDSAAKRLFNGAKPTSVLKKDIFIYDTGSVKFFIMPAGKGCIVIRKEVLH